MKDIATRIKNARQIASLSQDAMAEELSLSKAAYSKLERGVTALTVDRLQQIAEVLNMDIREFFETDVRRGNPHMHENEKVMYGYVTKAEFDKLQFEFQSIKSEIISLRMDLKREAENSTKTKARRKK